MEEKYILCNNQAERTAVLTKLEEEGYVWASGHKPTEYKILISDKVPIILKLRRGKITIARMYTAITMTKLSKQWISPKCEVRIERRTMEKFVSCVTKEQCSAVIQRMVAEGCRPINPDHAWCSYSREVVIRKNNDRHISYANRQWYTDHGYGSRIITAHQYLNLTTKPILISRKGRVVTAENKNTGEKAIATCSPDDTFDFGTGAIIAVARLIAKSEKGITKDAEMVLRQLLGDDVNSDAPAEEEPTAKFKIGDIVTLKDGLEVGKPYGAVDLLEIMYSNGYGKPMRVTDTIKCEDGDTAYDCAPVSGGRSFRYVEEMLESWDESKIREGDIVDVVSTGANYPCYTSWIDEYITDTALMRRFGYGNSPNRFVEKYEVVKIAPHGINGEMLAYIKPCSDPIGSCYIVGIRGLKKVTEE